MGGVETLTTVSVASAHVGLLDNVSEAAVECIIICGFSNEVAFPQTSSQKEHGDRIQLSGRVFASCIGDPGFVLQH